MTTKTARTNKRRIELPDVLAVFWPHHPFSLISVEVFVDAF